MNLIMRSRPLGVLVQHDSSFWNAITGALQSIPAALPSRITCQALLLTTSVLIEGAHSRKRGQRLVPCRLEPLSKHAPSCVLRRRRPVRLTARLSRPHELQSQSFPKVKCYQR